MRAPHMEGIAEISQDAAAIPLISYQPRDTKRLTRYHGRQKRALFASRS